MTNNPSDWISTGKAAALMGYSADHFRVKFTGVIPSKQVNGGYRRWLREAVERIADSSDSPQKDKK